MTTTTATEVFTPEITAGLVRYGDLLTGLRQEKNRISRASILGVMAEVAVTLAGLTFGNTVENDLTRGDHLAWGDTASILSRLSSAEAGDLVGRPWSALANSGTATEHAEAVKVVSAYLTAARTRPFAFGRFTQAATACTAGYPASYPTEEDYLAVYAVHGTR
jgi:hypothetical protein